MAGGIAHEINNPLFVLKAKIEILEDALSKKEDCEKELANVTSAKKMIHKISEIIKSLSTISRSSEDDPIQKISISDLISETLIICNHRFYQKGINVTQDLMPDLPKISCRPIEIGQVLINLLNNAHDALEYTAKPEIQITTKLIDEKVIIIVANNGPTIPEELKDKIFLSFYTTKEMGKGTGLGLSISLKLLKKNNGTLYLSPDTDQTRFVIELPLV